MAFNTSGAYTRIDNSFSNPVVGTTISPTDADTYFDDIDAALNAYYGTSTTSVAVGLGAKTFTTQTGKLFGAGRFVTIRSDANAANYMFGQVTSYSAGSLVVNVLAIGGSGTLADWTIYISGARGGAGPIAGIRQTYSTTTIDADPGAGVFRLDNAAPSSATTAYLDNLDTSGGTVSTIIDKWDDSTNTSRGFLRFEKEDDNSIWAEFTVTGSVVDGTGYRKVTLTDGSSSGTFVNGDAFRIFFGRAGDKGADGSMGGSTGAVDNRLLRSDGTGGTTIQNSGITVDDSGNMSGVATLTTTGGIELGNASDTTLSRSSAGVLAVEGVAVSLNSTSATHTAGTIELGAATDTTLSRASAGTLAVEGVNVLTTATGAAQGKQTIFIPAIAMVSRTTNGPSSGTVELTTNKIMVKSLDFDTTTQEFAQFSVWFPKSWNLGTVTFKPSLSQLTTAAGGVVFGLAGVAVSNGDDLDTALGTAQTSTATVGTLNKEYQGAESAAITIAGTPAAGDRVIFQINRTVADASDTLAQDARLHGVTLFFTTNASTDA